MARPDYLSNVPTDVLIWDDELGRFVDGPSRFIMHDGVDDHTPAFRPTLETYRDTGLRLEGERIYEGDIIIALGSDDLSSEHNPTEHNLIPFVVVYVAHMGAYRLCRHGTMYWWSTVSGKLRRLGHTKEFPAIAGETATGAIGEKRDATFNRWLSGKAGEALRDVVSSTSSASNAFRLLGSVAEEAALNFKTWP